MRIVFMGTPEFAVASLNALLQSRYKVVGVVTAPDKPANRGLKMHVSAVKEYAMENNLPLLQPESLKSGEFISALKNLNADIFVVVAFRVLPEVVWALPKYGTFNLHASLLPQYRGAAPINRAIINGEKETGVTTFFITHRVDTGDIIMQEKIGIEEIDDAGSVHDKLMRAGAALVVKTVDKIQESATSFLHKNDNTFLQGVIIHKQVENTELKPAPKIFREDCRINWKNPVEDVYNFIRGLSPYPGAFTELENEKGDKLVLKIYKTAKHKDIAIPAGEIKMNPGNRLLIGCANGAIEILELQAEGRKRMSAVDFFNGFHLFNKEFRIKNV